MENDYTYEEVLDYEGNLISVQRSDGWSIPADPANSDYQAYLASLEADEHATTTEVAS